MKDLFDQSERGCFAYENWKAAIAGEPLKSALEYPLFTDTRIIGDVEKGYGPYKLLNAVPTIDTDLLLPYIVLRIEYHGISRLDEMKRTNVDRYHGGSFNDEIAALVSLCLGIRLKSGGITRLFEPDKDPRGHPAAWELQHNPILLKPMGQRLILPQAIGEHSLYETTLISGLPALSARESIALIRAARLYQDAIWIIESEPEISWLLLVSAVEVAAGHWRITKELPMERLRASRPDLEALLLEAGGEELLSKVANQIADSLGATRKFIDFILEFLPEPPSKRPPEIFQVSWKREDMITALRRIYNWRSRALHGGIPFPAPMCLPPSRHEDAFDETPMGFAMGTKGAVWVAKDTPMLLHVFEYIVRQSLLNWWKSMLAVKRVVLQE
jgi:hypothetical protein